MKTKKRSKMPAGSAIIPLNVPGDMRKRIRVASDKARLSDADIMRLAIDRGIGLVEKMFHREEEQAA